MHLRIAALALALSCLLTLSLSKGVIAQTESTTVTTPAGATHGSLVSGNVPCAISHNQVGDCSPSLPGSAVSTATNTQTLQNKSISGAQNTLSAVPTGALATPQGNGAKVQLSTGATTNGDLAKYDANGNVIDSGSAGAPPSGAAGGDLGSTYPNPTVTSVSHVASGILGTANGGTGNSAGTAAPSGSATGDLSSSYPAPTVAKVNGNTPGNSCATHQFEIAVDTSARGTCGQPASSDLSDAANVGLLNGANAWSGLNTFNGGVALPSTTNPTGSNLYIDSSGVLHFVNSHDWPLVGACWLGDCSHPYFLTSMSFAATETSANQKSPEACSRQEFYSGAGGLTFCSFNSITHGKGITQSSPGFAFNASTITVTANASIANGQSVYGNCIANGTTVSSYSVGSVGLSTPTTCAGPNPTQVTFIIGPVPINQVTVGNFSLNEYDNEIGTLLASTSINAYASKYAPGTTVDQGINCNGHDFTGLKSSVAGAIECGEFDGLASGPDDNQARFVLDMPISENGPSGDGPTDWDSIIRMRPSSGDAHSPNPVTIDKGINITTMEGGSANGFYGNFLHGVFCDGGNTDCLNITSGTLPLRVTASASPSQAFLQFPLGANVNVGQVSYGNANIPDGTTVIATYQCEAAFQLSGCGANTNMELVQLSANLTGTIANNTLLTFTGTLADGSNFNAVFNDAFANWTAQHSTGYLKAGSTNNSGTVFDIRGFGEDSTNTTGVAYADINFDVQSNTHGSVAGNINLVPVGAGCIKLSGTCTGTFATQNYATPPAIGGTTPNAGSFSSLSASSTVSGSGFSTYLASPPAIGGSAAAAGSFTTLAASGNLTTQAHQISSGTALTSGNVAFGTGAGTSPTLNSITGDDRKFNINFTTGTTPAANAAVVTVTFANAYGASPQCMFSVVGSNAAAKIGFTYMTSTTTTVVLNNSTTALGASLVYTYNVQCIQ